MHIFGTPCDQLRRDLKAELYSAVESADRLHSPRDPAVANAV